MLEYSTFCIMGVQVIVFGKIKTNIVVVEVKASVNSAISHVQ